MSWNDPRTAVPSQSIWRDLAEDSFRQHLVQLEERTNAVPTDMQTFPFDQWRNRYLPDAGRTYSLPIAIEQQIVDDFAFLAAVEEGAQSVAAACLEEYVQPPGVMIRFAALDISLSDATKTALQDVCQFMTDAAALGPQDALVHAEAMFSSFIRLHFSRLLGRLRSAKWQKPKHLSKSHKKPLWQDFANLAHRVQFLYVKKEGPARRKLEGLISDLATVYEDFEAVASGSHAESLSMMQLIKKSFAFCKTEEIQIYAQRLQDSVRDRPTKQVGSAIKCLHQIEKIAAYWRICRSLINSATQYPALFQHGIHTAYLTPYTSVPTSIGYESWAKTCHVHAEVQLAVHYDLLPQSDATAPPSEQEKITGRLPRAVGTSKYLCHLCYQFLRAHGHFFPSNTHGRLYDQWTIPDLAEFDNGMRERYRKIIETIDDRIVSQIEAIDRTKPGESALLKLRVAPMTSRQNLLDMKLPG